jgi:hypothetical protein
MVIDAGQLADDYADELTAGRRFDPDELFNRQGITDIINKRRRVIQPVGIRNDLRPGRLLAALVETAMEETDLDSALEDLLTFQLEIEFYCPMGRRMGWTHLQFHRFAQQILGFSLHFSNQLLAPRVFLSCSNFTRDLSSTNVPSTCRSGTRGCHKLTG